ncbi:MAG: 16S rRNA (guanine(527)-N(7))-methyltransferase RsmG [Alphaproteobacteria bacterium]|nr:16S rRNA (guanine(527)-N(7))-methyltransferase RsmG [Alphaproteobacteria bacterium]
MSKKMTKNLPPDVLEKLKTYEALLLKWQKTINLVAPSTLPQAWERHFLDSLRLVDLIPQNLTVYDLGSGGGFPGMVLAIVRPDLKIYLIESDQRKCAFLQNVSRETFFPATIHNSRIEEAAKILPQPDLLTARALSALNNLVEYMEMFHAPRGIFMKGDKVQEEIAEARKAYNFDLVLHDNNICDVTNVSQIS